MHYCDHNATAPIRPESRDAMLAALTIGGNPSSVHARGRAARAVMDGAREAVARLTNAKPDQVIVTSGATESNCTALWGAVEAGGVTRLLVSAIEHPSVLKPAREIAERVAGVTLNILPVTADGVLDLNALRDALQDEGRALVAVMAANNETGVIQPVLEVSRACRATDALLLVDAVTAAGKIALDTSLCDYMTLSAHKLGGPQGAGALIVADGAPLNPLITGGGQQKGRRAGTENLSGAAGMGAAAAAVMAANADNGEEHARILGVRNGFEAALKQALPDARIMGAGAQRLCNTSCVCMPGLENIVISLDLDGVCVSSGSSCSSGKITPSHALTAMGMTAEDAAASIRVSFGWDSTPTDADAVVQSLVRLHARAKSRVAA